MLLSTYSHGEFSFFQNRTVPAGQDLRLITNISLKLSFRENSSYWVKPSEVVTRSRLTDQLSGCCELKLWKFSKPVCFVSVSARWSIPAFRKGDAEPISERPVTSCCQENFEAAYAVERPIKPFPITSELPSTVS